MYASRFAKIGRRLCIAVAMIDNAMTVSTSFDGNSMISSPPSVRCDRMRDRECGGDLEDPPESGSERWYGCPAARHGKHHHGWQQEDEHEQDVVRANEDVLHAQRDRAREGLPHVGIVQVDRQRRVVGCDEPRDCFTFVEERSRHGIGAHHDCCEVRTILDDPVEGHVEDPRRRVEGGLDVEKERGVDLFLGLDCIDFAGEVDHPPRAVLTHDCEVVDVVGTNQLFDLGDVVRGSFLGIQVEVEDVIEQPNRVFELTLRRAIGEHIEIDDRRVSIVRAGDTCEQEPQHGHEHDSEGHHDLAWRGRNYVHISFNSL